jgi:predicted ester cyclase
MTTATTDYHADLTVNAPVRSVFAAVSSAEGLSGWWTTDTGGSPEPGGELRFTFSDGVAVMRVDERTPPARERWTCLGHSGVITRFEHAFRAADQATIDELCGPDLADHNPAPGHQPTLAGFKQKVASFKALFPDLEEELQDIVASGDTVATRWVVTGALRQEFMGIPASGQPIRVEGMNFYRLRYPASGSASGGWPQDAAAPHPADRARTRSVKRRTSGQARWAAPGTGGFPIISNWIARRLRAVTFSVFRAGPRARGPTTAG